MKIRLREKFIHTSKIIFYRRKYPDLRYMHVMHTLHSDSETKLTVGECSLYLIIVTSSRPILASCILALLSVYWPATLLGFINLTCMCNYNYYTVEPELRAIACKLLYYGIIIVILFLELIYTISIRAGIALNSEPGYIMYAPGPEFNAIIIVHNTQFLWGHTGHACMVTMVCKLELTTIQSWPLSTYCSIPTSPNTHNSYYIILSDDRHIHSYVFQICSCWCTWRHSYILT